MDYRPGRVLLTAEEIRCRVRALASGIRRDYRRKRLAIVIVLKGSLFFAVDLMRQLDLPAEFDFVLASSYPDATQPAVQLRFTDHSQQSFRGRHVLVIDDILDTGATLSRVCREIRTRQPRSLRTCVLLKKRAHRKTKVRVDYVGFEVPNRFVVGYGLDFANRWRHLPHVAVLEAVRGERCRSARPAR